MGVGARVSGMRGSKPARAPHNHTNECRDRLEGLMANTGDERVERFAKRIADEMEEQVKREATRKARNCRISPGMRRR